MLNKGGFGPQSCSQPQKRPNLGKTCQKSPKKTFCADWEPDGCHTGHQLSTPFWLMIMRQVFGAQMWFLGPKVAPRSQEWPELTKTRQNHPKNFTFYSGRDSNSCYIARQPLCFY